MIRIDPPRARHAAEAAPYQRDQYDRTKNAEINARLGRLVADPAPVAAAFLSSDFAKDSDAYAINKLRLEARFDRGGDLLDPALFVVTRKASYPTREWTEVEPRLKNIALQRLLAEIVEQDAAMAPHAEAERRDRRSRHWCPDADELASAQHCGTYDPPAPPPPERPTHAERYLELARLLIEGCYASKPPIWLARLDPLSQDAAAIVIDQEYDRNGEPGAPFGRTAGARLLAMVERGYDLAFAPNGRRSVPPQVEITGASWRPLPDGSCWVLDVAEVEPAKQAKSKGGSK